MLLQLRLVLHGSHLEPWTQSQEWPLGWFAVRLVHHMHAGPMQRGNPGMGYPRYGVLQMPMLERAPASKSDDAMPAWLQHPISCSTRHYATHPTPMSRIPTPPSRYNIGRRPEAPTANRMCSAVHALLLAHEENHVSYYCEIPAEVEIKRHSSSRSTGRGGPVAVNRSCQSWCDGITVVRGDLR